MGNTLAATDSVDRLSSAAVPATSDTVDLANPAYGFMVGTAGDVKVDMVTGGTVTLKNVAAGVIHRLRVKRIYVTGTTAVNIVIFY
jgi:hypothetical protein